MEKIEEKEKTFAVNLKGHESQDYVLGWLDRWEEQDEEDRSLSKLVGDSLEKEIEPSSSSFLSLGKKNPDFYDLFYDFVRVSLHDSLHEAIKSEISWGRRISFMGKQIINLPFGTEIMRKYVSH